jgi:hypothetical protein
LPREPNGKVLKRVLREERMAPGPEGEGGQPAMAGGGETTP